MSKISEWLVPISAIVWAFFLSFLLSFLLTYLITYLQTYLLTYVLTCFLSYLLTFLLSYLITYLITYIITYLITFLLSFYLSRKLPHPSHLIPFISDLSNFSLCFTLIGHCVTIIHHATPQTASIYLKFQFKKNLLAKTAAVSNSDT